MTKLVAPTRLTALGDLGSTIQQWQQLNFADKNIGHPIELSGRASIQVQGDFSESDELVIEGSNDGENYCILQDELGNNLTFRNSAIKSIGTAVRHVRPHVTDGDEHTNLTVTILIKQR